MKVRWIRACVLLLAALLTAGCWDRVEVNDLALVAGSAMDWRDGQYVANILVPLPSQLSAEARRGGGGGGGGQNRAWYVDSASGDSVRDASDKLQARLARRLYFAHRRVTMFGRDLVEHGITEALDTLVRVPQNRLSTYIVMTEGEARDLLDTPTPLEQTSAEMVRELLTSTVSGGINLNDVIHDLLSPRSDPVLPVMGMERTSPGAESEARETIAFKGMAVLRDDRLAGILEREDGQVLIWLLGQAANPHLRLRAEGGVIVFEIRDSKVEIRSSASGGRVRFQVRLSGRGFIVENTGHKSWGSGENMAKVSRLLEKELSSRSEQVLRRVSQEFRADPVGLADYLYRQNPSAWHRVAPRWRDALAEARFEVTAQIAIQHAGSAVEPIGRPDWRIER